MPDKATKLLQSMRQATNNWSLSDLQTLYFGFGFEIRHGSNHDVVKHPEYPQLRATLPRHSSIAKGYISFAVKLIDQLQQLKEREEY